MGEGGGEKTGKKKIKKTNTLIGPDIVTTDTKKERENTP